MRLTAAHYKAPLPHLTVMGFLAFMCCLMCTPVSAQAEIMPPPLHLWEIPTDAEEAAEPEAPCAFAPLRHSQFRPSLGQGQSATALENSPQRKKKKKISANDTRSLFMAWLATFCAASSPVQESIIPLVVRKDAPRLPSWRGFVFFPLPPPSFA